MAQGAPNISTGISVVQPPSFAQDRHGNLIVANGLNRPLVWHVLDSVAYSAGVTAPTVAPTVTLTGGAGNASAGVYDCYFRYVDGRNVSKTPSSLSPVARVTAGNGDRFNWSVLTHSAEDRVASLGGTLELWRSTAQPGDGGAQVVYRVATITAGGATTYSDTVQDSTLQNNAIANPDLAMRILDQYDQLVANRFGVPPDFKPFVCNFQDRTFYAGALSYTTGTVATNGTTTITGTGTAWLSTFAGRYIWIEGETKPLLISSASATSITTSTAAATTASGKRYTIEPDRSEFVTLYYSEVDESESVPSSQNVVTIQQSTGDEDEITGLAPSGAYLLVTMQRHLYKLSFYAQPKVDVSVTKAADRGCVNNRCWVEFEGATYLMDQQGIYRYAGGVEPLSEPIQDLFRDGTIDWSVSKWFFASKDPIQQVIRFHVNFVCDSATRPKRWLEYNVRTQQWVTGSAVSELGASCLTSISGRTRVLMGGENDNIYLFGEGYSDHVTTATRGTATGGSTTTIVDSTASFTSSMVDAPVSIISGDGKRQTSRVTAVTGTQLTIAAVSTAVAAGAVYIVGGIPWSWKTGLFRTVEEHSNRQMHVVFQPTSAAVLTDVAVYANHSSSALTYEAPFDRGSAITVAAGDNAAVLNMKSARSSRANASGMETLALPGRADSDGQGLHFFAIGLSGAGGEEAVRLHSLQLDGVRE
jgi:hypothetical protein